MKLRNAEKRLLIAVSQIIENEGFSKIGVNKIAKQAKCDKVLIYRYFGGLEGLLAAWAKDNDFYTLAYQAYSERVTKAESSEDIIKLTQTVLLKQLNFLRTNKLMQELLAWELSGNSTFRRSQVESGRSGLKVLEQGEKKLGKEEEKVTVPDLRNKTEADAATLANSLKLGVVNGGTEASDVIEAGKICRQDLTPGTKVDKNATITYYVSSGKETVTIPTGIVGTQKDAASAALTQLGLQVSTTEDFSDTVAEGLVISVDPSEGSQVAPESTVTLVISKGSKDAEEIAIRDVIGLDEETAKSILSDFNIIVKTGTSSKVAEGEVMEVDPAVGTKVKKGSDVTIYVNSPSAQPTTPDENTPTPTPAEPGANTATDVTWSCSQTLSAPDQYQGGIAKIELIQDDGNGNETSITIMDGQAITSWPYSVNTNWSASSSASSTGRIVFYEMDSSGSYQAIAQYPSVPLSEG